jgi:predicted transcriptional regulator
MANKKSTFMGSYRLASILSQTNVGDIISKIYKKTRINYDEIKEYVDKLEERGFIKTEKNENGKGKPRKVIYVDARIKQKADEFIEAYNEFSSMFKEK